MEVVKGVVQQISVKEPKEGQYGKWANYGIKVNEKWYNGALNADKKTGLLTLKDKSYNEVCIGMEVQFVLEDKKVGDKTYSNINPKLFDIISSGMGAATNQQQQGYHPPTQEQNKPAPHQVVPAQTVEPAMYDAILNSVCYGNAIQMAILKHKEKPVPVDIDEKIDRMTRIYKKNAKDGTY